MTRKELWVFEKVELVNAHKILRLEALIGSQLWWVLGSFPANYWVADFFFFFCRDCFHSWNFICFPTVFGKQMKVHFIWTIERISVCQATTRKTKEKEKKRNPAAEWFGFSTSGTTDFVSLLPLLQHWLTDSLAFAWKPMWVRFSPVNFIY